MDRDANQLRHFKSRSVSANRGKLANMIQKPSLFIFEHQKDLASRKTLD